MIVIDASVAMKWVLPEDGSDAAHDLQSQELAAPALWLIEAGNALWRAAHTGKLSVPEARAGLFKLETAPVRSIPSEAYLAQALDLAIRLRHPIYDCLYLATAIGEHTHVVSADARFLTAVTRDRTLKAYVRSLT